MIDTKTKTNDYNVHEKPPVFFTGELTLFSIYIAYLLDDDIPC
jgi:hypothetical protein